MRISLNSTFVGPCSGAQAVCVGFQVWPGGAGLHVRPNDETDERANQLSST